MPRIHGPHLPWLSRCTRAVAALWGGIDDHSREVASATVTAICVKVSTAALQFALSFILARTLGAEGTGIFFLAFTVTWVTAVIARLGMDNVVLRQVALNASRMRWRRVKGLVRLSTAVVLSSSAVCSLAVFFAAPWLAHNLFGAPDLVPVFRWASLAIPPMASLLLAAEMLKGLRKILLSLLVQGSMVPGFTAVGVLVLGPVFGHIGAVWAFVGAATVTAALAFVFWSRATPILKGTDVGFPLRTLFRSAMPLYWYSLMFMTINWSSFLILGIYGSNEEVGIFGVAWRTSLLISFLILAVEAVAAPKFAILHGQGDLGALRAVYQRTTFGLIVAVLPILMVVLLFPQEIMAIFGHEFRSGGQILAIAAIGRFGALVTGPVSTLLVMTGHERPARNIITLSATIALILNFSLIPLFGAQGAAIAVGSALTLNSFAGVILVRKYLGFWATPSVNVFFQGPGR